LEDPVQLDVLKLELRSFCPFSHPIQLVGKDKRYRDGLSSEATSDSGSNEGRSLGAESPGVCETPPEQQHDWAYTTQPAVPRLVEPGICLEATESSEQTFAFDFDFESGVWESTDPYLQLGSAFPKDVLDRFTQPLH
jgi:hypothetical protein